MIGDMYITLMPVILAGVCNMIFTKTSLYRNHAAPIDGGIRLRDGKRLFGDNKTYIGFISMILFSMAVQTLWGILCLHPGVTGRNALYDSHGNTVFFNLMSGALLGFSYMICELPNSFIKRRIGIVPGKTKLQGFGILFFFIDQADSVIGVVFILSCLTPVSPKLFLLYVLLGSATHITVNLILHALKIRKNI